MRKAKAPERDMLFNGSQFSDIYILAEGACPSIVSLNMNKSFVLRSGCGTVKRARARSTRTITHTHTRPGIGTSGTYENGL